MRLVSNIVAPRRRGYDILYKYTVVRIATGVTQRHENTMNVMNNYFSKYYLTESQLSTAAGIGIDELDRMIHQRLLPAPAYVVTESGEVISFVFGKMAAVGALPGRYFHPAQTVWIEIARDIIATWPANTAAARLKQRFTSRYADALAKLNLTTWRLYDSFDEHGAPISASLQARTESAWQSFLNGTFSLCVANPISEAHIAHKEVLQEKLTQQSENGKKTMYSANQAAAMHELINAYDVAAMPFSPAEYALSSRKRLVDDLRSNITIAEEGMAIEGHRIT